MNRERRLGLENQCKPFASVPFEKANTACARVLLNFGSRARIGPLSVVCEEGHAVPIQTTPMLLAWLEAKATIFHRKG